MPEIIKTNPNHLARHLIQHLIDRFGYTTYFELGTRGFHTFNFIRCPVKQGIDPELHHEMVDRRDSEKLSLYPFESDKYFAYNHDPFDIAFIDGLHESQQVIRDIVSCYNSLLPNGRIVLHDHLPTCVEQATPGTSWSQNPQDVWKGLTWFRHEYPDIESCVLNMDWGLGVIYKKPTDPDTIEVRGQDWVVNLDFEWYMRCRKEALNVVRSYEGYVVPAEAIHDQRV